MTDLFDSIRFASPLSKTRLEYVDENTLRCPDDGTLYKREEGIWRMLHASRKAHFSTFQREYEAVRNAEERGSDDPNYYRQLPHHDITGKRSAEWLQRHNSFRILMDSVLYKLEKDRGRQLKVLELGAGNGWLSYNVSLVNHIAVAVDLGVSKRDGLGAHVHYDAPILPVQADFDQLPFESDQFDLVVFNAALHYSEHYETSIAEALRVRTDNGALAIMDTPLYKRAESGQKMVAEREALFTTTHGFASNSLNSENFLTDARLDTLANTFELEWEQYSHVSEIRQGLRNLRHALTSNREAPRFPVIVAAEFKKETIKEYRRRIFGRDQDDTGNEN